MANPSKFVVKSAFCLAVRIVDSDVEPLTGKISYVVNEGVHGAFRTLLEHDDVLKPEIVASGSNVVSKRSVVSDVIGPTRNFLDKVISYFEFQQNECQLNSGFLRICYRFALTALWTKVKLRTGLCLTM